MQSKKPQDTVCSSTLSHHKKAFIEPWSHELMFPGTPRVLKSNTVKCSIKDSSTFVPFCSKESTTTLTTNPQHDGKVITRYIFNQVIDSNLCIFFYYLFV